MDFDTVLEAVYEFKKTMTAKYNIEPTRLYIGFLDMLDLKRNIGLDSWYEHRTEKMKLMGLDVYVVKEERHLHIC